jgi:hypothetical protein
MSNVMAIRSAPDETLEKATLIRAEETEDMVKWTQKILTEIFKHSDPSLHGGKEDPTDRWTTIFDSVRTNWDLLEKCLFNDECYSHRCL